MDTLSCEAWMGTDPDLAVFVQDICLSLAQVRKFRSFWDRAVPRARAFYARRLMSLLLCAGDEAVDFAKCILKPAVARADRAVFLSTIGRLVDHVEWAAAVAENKDDAKTALSALRSRLDRVKKEADEADDVANY